MQETEIYISLTKIFHNIFDNDSIVLTNSTSAVDIDGWDSLNHINLILAIEAHFKLKFTTAEVEKMEGVGDMVGAIRKKLAG